MVSSNTTKSNNNNNNYNYDPSSPPWKLGNNQQQRPEPNTMGADYDDYNYYYYDASEQGQQHKPDEPAAVVAMTINEVIDKIGFGRFQWKLLFLCGAGWAADNMFLSATGFLTLTLTAQYKLNSILSGLIATSFNVGLLIGAYFWGVMSDVIGRKIAFISTLGIASVFALASAFGPDVYYIYAAMVLLGSGVGGNLPVDGALFAEFSPTEKRYFIVIMSAFWSVGALITAGIAWIFIPLPHPLANIQGWRWMMGILGVINASLFIFRRGVPESPRFLMVKGKTDKALEILRMVAKQNKVALPENVVLTSCETSNGSSSGSDNAPNATPVSNATSGPTTSDYGCGEEQRAAAGDIINHQEQEQQYQQQQQQQQQNSVTKKKKKEKKSRMPIFFDLFSRSLVRKTLLLWIIWFSVSMAYGGFSVFMPSIFAKEGIHTEDIYRNSFLMQLGGLPGIFLATFLVETRMGRRFTMAIFLVLSGLFIFFFLLTKNGILILLFSMLMSFFSMGAWSGIYTYTPEAYPTYLRGSGIGSASCMNRIASIAAPMMGSALININVNIPLTIFASMFVLGGIASVFLPETRGAVLVDSREGLNKQQQQQQQRSTNKQNQNMRGEDGEPGAEATSLLTKKDNNYSLNSNTNDYNTDSPFYYDKGNSSTSSSSGGGGARRVLFAQPTTTTNDNV